MYKRIVVFIHILIVAAACKPTKHIAEDENLLVRNKISMDAKLDEDEVSSIIKQHPNRKLFKLFRFHLWIYNLVDQEKLAKKVEKHTAKWEAKNAKRESKGKEPKGYTRLIGEWLSEDVGEKPVLYDELLKEKSTKQLNQYLKNKGYYNGFVTDSVLIDKQKATVYYNIHAGKPYTIRRIIFSINDTLLIGPIKRASKKSLLRPGINCDVDVLEQERERLEKAMQDLGYYRFSRQYVFFEIDSNLNKNKIDIKQIIKNPVVHLKEHPDSLVEDNHELYFIRNVYVNSNFKPHEAIHDLDTLEHYGIHFLYDNRNNFRPDVLGKTIFIKPDELYRLSKVQYTNGRLAALKTFKFINISFEDAGKEGGKRYLDCFINLVPIPRQSITTELESTTNRIAPLGISGGFVYQNKNTFKGAEILQLKLSGGVEAQKQLTLQDDATITSSQFFNTIEYGPELSLNIPSLLLPGLKGKLPKYNNPKTSFTIAYNHQKRLDFTRDVGAINISYNWKSSKYNAHVLQPIDISLVNIEKTPAFEEQLNASNNSFLINTYRDYLIMASNYSFMYTNQDINKFKNFVFFHFQLEGAGNLLRTFHNLSGAEKNADGGYELINIQYAQYVKPEIEFRYYEVINKNSNMVYRLFAGIGVPLNNLSVLPFEKSYFGGGANGIRAWTARTLGPGSLSETASTAIDRIGDIQLEGNVEYRFDIIDMLEGAAFVDMGNIWLRNDDPKRPGGQFEFDSFYKEAAIGAGLGIRFDFSFLIIRLDAGIPIKNPSLPDGEKWIFQSKEKTNLAREEFYGAGFDKYRSRVNFNFGIGYPF